MGLYSIEVYDPPARAWAYAPSLGAVTSDLAAAVDAGGQVYAVGWSDRHGESSNYVEANASPGCKWWVPLAGLRFARSGLAAVADAHGRVYAIGGVNERHGVLRSMEVYDPPEPLASAA